MAPRYQSGTEKAFFTSSLEEIVDALPDGIMILDRNWRITHANRTARSISRLLPEHLNGPTHWELFPETIGTHVEVSYHEAMHQRVARRMPTFFYAPFQVWLDVHILPVEDGIALYYRDISEQRRQEAATRAADERARLALEAANGVGTWDWDIPNDRVYADKPFAELYGVDPEDAANGAPISSFTRNILLEDAEPTNLAIQEAIRAGSQFAAEYRIRQADGSISWVSARGRCTYDDALHKPQRFSGVAFDITERKRTEAALIQSEKLAAVGRMASSIAHEINDPLESVTNLLYIARTYTLPPEVQHFLSLAEQELRRVSVIANQTLRFHKQAAVPREITCVDLFTTVLSLYEGRLKNSAIVVKKRKRAQRPIACFEGDIRQVLNNLVSNAIDAMPNGGSLLLRSREATDWRTGRQGLALTVADTGSGMALEILARIFEAFFTTKGNQGTGLGLWISREILERHQARMLLRSSQSPRSHGTVFIIFLPFQAILPNLTERPN
jgi:PAS domain S-box-containing protein